MVDKNASVGCNCYIDNSVRKVWSEDRAATHGYVIEDGRIVIVANGVVPNGTIIPMPETLSDIKTFLFTPKTLLVQSKNPPDDMFL